MYQVLLGQFGTMTNTDFFSSSIHVEQLRKNIYWKGDIYVPKQSPGYYQSTRYQYYRILSPGHKQE